jgi:hypothetical protein
MDKKAPRASSSVDWFCQQPSPEFAADSVVPPICPLAHAAARVPLAVSGEDATSVVIGSPPFQVCQQAWGLLRRRPGAACESCHAMADGQIHPLNERRIQPPREAQSL